MNQLIISGNIGRDAEIRSISNELYIAVHVAVYVNKNYTQWVEVLITRSPDKIDAIKDTLKKGQKILAWGKPRYSAFLNKNNQPVASVSLWAEGFDYLSAKSDTSATPQEASTEPQTTAPVPAQPAQPTPQTIYPDQLQDGNTEEELPF